MAHSFEELKAKKDNPLVAAIQKNDVSKVRELLAPLTSEQRSFLLNDPKGPIAENFLMNKALEHGAEMIQALVEFGANIPNDPYENNLFIMAMINDHLPVAEFFLSNGISVDTKDEANQESALGRLCKIAGGFHGENLKTLTAAIDFLLLNNADTNIQNLSGQTALHLICSVNPSPEELPVFESIIIKLLIKGAKTDLVNAEGNTPLDVCKNESIKKLLVNAEAILSLKEVMPLIQAAKIPRLKKGSTFREFPEDLIRKLTEMFTKPNTFPSHVVGNAQNQNQNQI